MQVDENTPNSFSIFDAGSVDEARQKLKSNIDEAVSQKSDPAERVASIGKPGESQEANAERIRQATVFPRQHLQFLLLHMDLTLGNAERIRKSSGVHTAGFMCSACTPDRQTSPRRASLSEATAADSV
jgi:hypothetical protein